MQGTHEEKQEYYASKSCDIQVVIFLETLRIILEAVAIASALSVDAFVRALPMEPNRSGFHTAPCW